MTLQKIHQALWDGIKASRGADAEVTHADGPVFVFRPHAGAQSVCVRFETKVWEAIRVADDARLEAIARNLRQMIDVRMTDYRDNPAFNAFEAHIHDKVLDQ